MPASGAQKKHKNKTMNKDKDKDKDKFINEFLKYEGTLSGSEWGSDNNLKTRFQKILRWMLRRTGAAWINPVVLIVLKHPERYLKEGQAGYLLQERIHDSLFQPIAVDAGVQKTIDVAYAEIIKANGPKHGHFVQVLEEEQISSVQCYECTFNNTSSPTITISRCNRNGEPKTEKKVLGTVEHYRSLFKKSGTVWFLPSTPFSLSDAKSEIYEKYLIGTYLGFRRNNRRKTCACAIWQQDKNLQEALEWTIRLFFLRRLKDQGA